MNTDSVLGFAAAALLLTAVLVVWRRELRASVRLLAAQGLALAIIPFVQGIDGRDGELIAVAIIVVAFRAITLPWLLDRAVRAESDPCRESEPLLNTTASLLVTAVLTVAAFVVSQPLQHLGGNARLVGAALAVVLIAVFVMITRRSAVSQAVGFLMLDNGITATAFLISAGVPLIVELGASLDVLVAVVVIGVLTGRIRQLFGGTDLDQLRELHE